MTAKIIKPKKFTDHFYQLGTPFFPVYLSVGEDAMLIEGGTSGELTLIKEQLKELGIAPERIKYIALTHSHHDHIGLLPYAREEWKNAGILAGKATADALTNEKAYEQFLPMDDFIAGNLMKLGETGDKPGHVDNFRFTIDTVLEEGSRFDLGEGIIWTVYLLPGHSHCQIGYYEDKEGTVVVGDSAGLYFPHADAFWPEYFTSLDNYCNTLRKLSNFHGKRVALSHFGVVEGDSSTFFKKSLAATRDYHKEMIERTGKGEDLKTIATEKCKWVLSNHNYMTYEITDSMCQLLIKRSLKDAEKEGLFEGI